jgi:hypothetical protein
VNLDDVEVVLQLARMMSEGNMEFGRLLDFICQSILWVIDPVFVNEPG